MDQTVSRQEKDATRIDAERKEGGLRIKGHYKKPSNNRSMISVVTVVLNGEMVIEETIQSVINQTYQNVEYIIIDGGSTDNTANIIKKYENIIDYWISEHDEGIYDAMNKGVELATGEWIIFMNAGDMFFEKETIRKIFTDCPQNAELIYGNCQIRYDNFLKIFKTPSIRDLWKGIGFQHQSLFTKRNLLLDNKFNTQDILGADFGFLWQMFAKNCRFYYSDTVVCTCSSNGLVDKNRIKALKEVYAITKRYRNDWIVHIYYAYLIFLEMLKNFSKRLLPKKMVTFIRQRGTVEHS